MYAQARQAIRTVQPNAQVLVGGLTNPRGFLPAMLAADPSLRGAIDGVAIHPYGRAPALVLRNVRSARLALDSLGLGEVPLWITELGWTTSPAGALDYLPERLRPVYIRRTVTALGHVDCGIAAIGPVHVADPRARPRRPAGLVRHQPAERRFEPRC